GEALLLGVRVEPHQHLRRRPREDRRSARRPRAGAEQRAGRTLLRRLEGPVVHHHRRPAPARHLAGLPRQGARDDWRFLTHRKLGVRDRVAVALYAAQRGLAAPPQIAQLSTFVYLHVPAAPGTLISDLPTRAS